MGYRLLNSNDTVQVFGPNLVRDALSCTIQTSPSGAIVNRAVPLADFQADQGATLLGSLADAVESILGEGTAVAASGTQGVDPSGLLYDAVRFTVAYTPAGGTPGAITADVEIPVDVVTADTQFSSFLTGGSAAERIAATYAKLQAMAGG
jgi:hypothetical protein